MSKLKSLSLLSGTCETLRRRKEIIALITGCFDILHLDHIRLFRFAKRNADILIVGLDNDRVIRNSKGPNRPFFKLKDRAEMLSAIADVDYIFSIKAVDDFKSPSMSAAHDAVVRQLQPHLLITNPLADAYWKDKRRRAQKFGIRFLPWKMYPHKIIKLGGQETKQRLLEAKNDICECPMSEGN